MIGSFTLTNFFYRFFGADDKNLSATQMCLRALFIFFITFFLIRIAGRRSFGFHKTFDNIIAILLGAILSRTVVGASPFLPTIAACLVIVILHRLFGLSVVFFPKFDKWIQGSKILLYDNGTFFKSRLARALTSEADVREEVRIHLHQSSMKDIEKIYIEKNGKLSFLKK